MVETKAYFLDEGRDFGLSTEIITSSKLFPVQIRCYSVTIGFDFNLFVGKHGISSAEFQGLAWNQT